MRKFLLSVAVFFLIVFGLFGFVYLRSIPEEAARFKHIEKKFDIINLGTSHGRNFTYENVNLEWGNFAVPANSPYYDWKNYLYLKRYLKKDAIVLIPISYFSFGASENREDRGEGNPFVNQFYHYLPNHSIKNYSVQKKISVYIHSIQIKLNETLELSPRGENVTNKNFSNDSDLVKKLERHSIARTRQHKELSTILNHSINMAYYKYLINDATENGFRPILVTVPYYYQYSENFSNIWLQKEYFTKIRSLSEDLGVAYMNYSDHSGLIRNPDFFKNSDHLSTDGRAEFNKVFFEDLVDMKYLDAAILENQRNVD